MSTLSASFEQLKEIATLQEVADLSERYTVDSAFESLCSRFDILDENIENLRSLQVFVEKGETGPALETFCGESFKEAFGVDNVSMESLSIAGVALVIWCILAIVAIIEFFMMVFDMVFGKKGGGGGTFTIKPTNKAEVMNFIRDCEDKVISAIEAGKIPTDAEINRVFNTDDSDALKALGIPKDIIDSASERIMKARERIRQLADEKMDSINSNNAQKIGQCIREASRDGYSTLVKLPVKVDRDDLGHGAGGDDIVLVENGFGGIRIVAPSAIRAWLEKITKFVGSDMNGDIAAMSKDLASLGTAVSSCIANMGDVITCINRKECDPPPNIDSIREFWETKTVRDQYFKDVPSKMARALGDSVDKAIAARDNGREYASGKNSVYELFEKNRVFYMNLFDDLRGHYIDDVFTKVEKEIEKKLLAALRPVAKMRNADDRTKKFTDAVGTALDSANNIWRSVLQDNGWDFSREMDKLRDANARTKSSLDGIHNGFKSLGEQLQTKYDEMRKNFPKESGGFRKIFEMVMNTLGNVATDSKEEITIILGFIAGYLRVADNVTKSYKHAMDAALTTLLNKSEETEDALIQIIAKTTALSVPVITI